MTMLTAAILLAAVTATLQPSQPAVGDLITIQFEAPVTLEAPEHYEIVSQQGARVVVRTFRPAPFVMHGVVGGVAFQNLVVPVRSVLDPRQPMTPAPLVPPREVSYARAPFQAIAGAAVLAALIWFLVWRRARAGVPRALARQSPEERFRNAVAALRARPDAKRWALLADETRRLLAATRPRLGAELTTRELLPRLAHDEEVVVSILRQGDLEKFSRRGAEPLPFDDVAERALALAATPSQQEGSGR